MKDIIDQVNQISENDIRVIKEFFAFCYPQFADTLEADIWKVEEIQGRKFFFCFGIFFYVGHEGVYVAYKLPDDPEEPYGTRGWVVSDPELKNVLLSVSVLRMRHCALMFFENEFDFDKHEFIPRTSRYECAMRNRKYIEKDFDELGEEEIDFLKDLFNKEDDPEEGDNEC
jgi:hypothetical protein